MRLRVLRAFVALLLILGIGGVTAVHEDVPHSTAPGGELAAHHHGPHAPCPEGVEHHCLACGAQALFAPAPPLGRLAVPVSVRSDRTRAEGTDRNADRPAASGRSPPGSLSIA